jgi:hypothetical protein
MIKPDQAQVGKLGGQARAQLPSTFVMASGSNSTAPIPTDGLHYLNLLLSLYISDPVVLSLES